MEHVAQELQEQENVIVTQDGFKDQQEHQWMLILVMLVLLDTGATTARVIFSFLNLHSFSHFILIEMNH